MMAMFASAVQWTKADFGAFHDPDLAILDRGEFYRPALVAVGASLATMTAWRCAPLRGLFARNDGATRAVTNSAAWPWRREWRLRQFQWVRSLAHPHGVKVKVHRASIS